MNEHDQTKRALEREAVSLFIDVYNANHEKNYRLLFLQEKPDAVLEYDGKTKHGLEITHLFYDQSEAKALLEKSNESVSGIQKLSCLIEELNERIAVKEEKRKNYSRSYPVSLLIRNASSHFGMSDILRVKESIRKPKEIFVDVWFLSRDGSDEWLLFNLDGLIHSK